MSALYQAHAQQGMLLNANECSNEPAQVVLDQIAQDLKAGHLNRYPDDQATALAQQFAKLYDLDANGILVGNGSDATLQMMINSLCRQDRPLVTLKPDFGMYDFYASAMQSRVYAYQTKWQGEFDVEAFVQFAKEKQAGLVLFSNPNNPTGHQVDRQTLLQMAKVLDPIVLAVDEAYMDFSDQSLLDQVQSLQNVIVTRTLSKAWGLAGIRCGFLVTNEKLASELAKWRVVYSVSTLDQIAAKAGLAHPEVKDEYVACIQQETKRIAKTLEQVKNLKVGPMHANFYAISFVDEQGNLDLKRNEQLEQSFVQQNIQLRTWLSHERIRITIGLPEQNDLVLKLIQES
ncbi:MAG: histidinol-phosphate transaminase [Erysipelotrichaceae bacterium]|nr:histidinol-phosphate transaminase [Erysipelotrichaceae bacterium]